MKIALVGPGFLSSDVARTMTQELDGPMIVVPDDTKKMDSLTKSAIEEQKAIIFNAVINRWSAAHMWYEAANYPRKKKKKMRKLADKQWMAANDTIEMADATIGFIKATDNVLFNN